jgi:signal transduction histidine kinase
MEMDRTQSPQPRLLIVDDQAYNLQLLERVFSKSYEVVSVDSGEAALALLGEQTFDAVLLDIMMPGMDGLAVLKVIRDAPETADLPVILVSALSEDQHVANGLELGANDYITKPFDVTVAQARVHTQVTLKQLTDERKQTIANLRAANDLKERLMRIASHDLKGPLNNLHMVSFLLRESAGDDAELHKLLDMADENINLMLALTEEFLESGVARGDEIELKPEPLSIPLLIEQTLHQYEPVAFQKDIHLVTAFDDDHPVIADPNRMLQVLSNLVSNAIKYSPSGSTVRVETQNNGRRLRINVIDQGEGIPADERSQLFQPFSRLSTRPTAGEHSTGLGLWIVQQLVALHGGEVGVDCPSSGGSVFWVDLPLAAEE